jgi:hypothetical protein
MPSKDVPHLKIKKIKESRMKKLKKEVTRLKSECT